MKYAKEKFMELFTDKYVPKPKDYTLAEQKKNNSLVADMLVLESLTVWKNKEEKTLKLFLKLNILKQKSFQH